MTAPRCYDVKQLMELLHVGRTVFYQRLRAGGYPFLEEVRPRVGRKMLFRADLVDRYLTGDWKPAPAKLRAITGGRHFFGSAVSR